jgi:hypothetical protein
MISSAVAGCWSLECGTLAQDASDEQERLHAQMLREPTNYPLTFAYVKVATDRGDYEAAIAALERLLYYNPNLAHVKYDAVLQAALLRHGEALLQGGAGNARPRPGDTVAHRSLYA